MLYPLSYEGLACALAQRAGRALVRRARAGRLAPDGLCRIGTGGPIVTRSPLMRHEVHAGS
jgi:hypothetical protein